MAGGGLALLLGVAKTAVAADGRGGHEDIDGILGRVPLWDMALRCCWSLSMAHPVSSPFVHLELHHLIHDLTWNYSLG
jgi:hypothetical protein